MTCSSLSLSLSPLRVTHMLSTDGVELLVEWTVEEGGDLLGVVERVGDQLFVELVHRLVGEEQPDVGVPVLRYEDLHGLLAGRLQLLENRLWNGAIGQQANGRLVVHLKVHLPLAVIAKHLKLVQVHVEHWQVEELYVAERLQKRRVRHK